MTPGACVNESGLLSSVAVVHLVLYSLFIFCYYVFLFSTSPSQLAQKLIAFEVQEHKPQFVLGVLCIVGCPVQLIREVFSRLHLCRHTFASL